MTPEEAADVVAVGQLQARYGDAVTRRAWDELAALFAPGAPIRLDLRTREPIELEGGEAVGRFIANAVERFEYFEFAMLNAVVTRVDADSATGRVYIWELRQEGASPEGGPTWSNAFGVYDDEYGRLGDDWVFTRRSYRSLARTFPAMDVTEVLPAP